MIALVVSLFLESSARRSTQPALQLVNQWAAALLAHAQAFLRRKAVDLTFDGEQDINALDRLGRDRRLAEPREIEELAPTVAPARGLDNGTPFAIDIVELAEARVGVGLHQSGIACQMLLRMHAATVQRVEEHGCRRIWAGKRTVVAHIGPDPASPGLALGQDRHRGVIGVDALGAKTCLRIASTNGIRVAAAAPTQSASVDTSRSMPSRR